MRGPRLGHVEHGNEVQVTPIAKNQRLFSNYKRPVMDNVQGLSELEVIKISSV
jgi:hypothetical protein